VQPAYEELSEERLAKLQILAFVEELCQSLTLHDVREWYAQASLDRDDAQLP
jgi:hypothetical protein